MIILRKFRSMAAKENLCVVCNCQMRFDDRASSYSSGYSCGSVCFKSFHFCSQCNYVQPDLSILCTEDNVSQIVREDLVNGDSCLDCGTTDKERAEYKVAREALQLQQLQLKLESLTEEVKFKLISSTWLEVWVAASTLLENDFRGVLKTAADPSQGPHVGFALSGAGAGDTPLGQPTNYQPQGVSDGVIAERPAHEVVFAVACTLWPKWNREGTGLGNCEGVKTTALGDECELQWWTKVDDTDFLVDSTCGHVWYMDGSSTTFGSAYHVFEDLVRNFMQDDDHNNVLRLLIPRTATDGYLRLDVKQGGIRVMPLLDVISFTSNDHMYPRGEPSFQSSTTGPLLQQFPPSGINSSTFAAIAEFEAGASGSLASFSSNGAQSDCGNLMIFARTNPSQGERVVTYAVNVCRVLAFLPSLKDNLPEAKPQSGYTLGNQLVAACNRNSSSLQLEKKHLADLFIFARRYTRELCASKPSLSGISSAWQAGVLLPIMQPLSQFPSALFPVKYFSLKKIDLSEVEVARYVVTGVRMATLGETNGKHIESTGLNSDDFKDGFRECYRNLRQKQDCTCNPRKSGSQACKACLDSIQLLCKYVIHGAAPASGDSSQLGITDVHKYVNAGDALCFMQLYKDIASHKVVLQVPSKKDPQKHRHVSHKSLLQAAAGCLFALCSGERVATTGCWDTRKAMVPMIKPDDPAGVGVGVAADRIYNTSGWLSTWMLTKAEDQLECDFGEVSGFQLQFPFSTIPLRIPRSAQMGSDGAVAALATACHHPLLCEISACHGENPSHTCARPSHLVMQTQAMNTSHLNSQQRALGTNGLGWEKGTPVTDRLKHLQVLMSNEGYCRKIEMPTDAGDGNEHATSPVWSAESDEKWLASGLDSGRSVPRAFWSFADGHGLESTSGNSNGAYSALIKGIMDAAAP